jgi:hypothetical protein
MPEQRLTISWEKLSSPRVDEKLKEQDAIRTTHEHYQSAPPPPPLMRHRAKSLLYNTIVYTAIFGLLGGLVGWACGEVMHFRPNLRAQAREMLDARKELIAGGAKGVVSKQETDAALDDLRYEGRNNPYFVIYDDDGTTAEEKEQAAARVDAREELRAFVADVLFYGLCGLSIALFISIADPVMERNLLSAVLNGAVGSVLGLIGGVLLSFVIDDIYRRVLGLSGAGDDLRRQVLARGASWGVLGMFLALAPGLVLRNFKRMAIGAAAGAVGGLAGGALLEILTHSTHNLHTARLAGMVSIGLLAGIGTGLLESVAKTGWIKVVAGVITGKQFVLYRNPTYLGSAPQCQIYLFKDSRVGRRHAAIHQVRGGYELEDLPLGTPTLLNGRPVTRARLRNGDKIQAGSFTFLFQEKPRVAAGP